MIRTISRAAASSALALAITAAPLLAHAHGGTDGGAHHGFGSGFAHPFTGLDHLMAMLAVGIWSALAARQARARSYLSAPAVFACVLLLGALLGAAGVSLPAVEPMVAASLLVLGLLVASRTPLGAAPAALLVGGFALFHGMAHGDELAGAAALGGMVLATVLLHVAGLALGHALRSRSHWWPRLAGAVAAAYGATLLLI